jgi:hypothetical protein
MKKKPYDFNKKSKEPSNKDYSGDKNWEELRSIYSRSQQDFPIALGMGRVLQLKRSIIGRKPLFNVPPTKLQYLIKRITKSYNILKERHDNGEFIKPDIKARNVAKL